MTYNGASVKNINQRGEGPVAALVQLSEPVHVRLHFQPGFLISPSQLTASINHNQIFNTDYLLTHFLAGLMKRLLMYSVQAKSVYGADQTAI